MNTILFFAHLKELLSLDKLEMNATGLTIRELIDALTIQDGYFSVLLAQTDLLVAVNQTMVNFDTKIEFGDEIAFFPPVTGG